VPATIKVRDDGTVKCWILACQRWRRSAVGRHFRVADDHHSRLQSTPVPYGHGGLHEPRAKGRVVDRRADIWAFGCVLFEMTRAKRLRWRRRRDVMVAVLRDEPTDGASASTPAHLRAVEGCLR
jgi:hypothetical protein